MEWIERKDGAWDLMSDGVVLGWVSPLAGHPSRCSILKGWYLPGAGDDGRRRKESWAVNSSIDDAKHDVEEKVGKFHAESTAGCKVDAPHDHDEVSECMSGPLVRFNRQIGKWEAKIPGRPSKSARTREEAMELLRLLREPPRWWDGA